jgi:hypothetical protein
LVPASLISILLFAILRLRVDSIAAPFAVFLGSHGEPAGEKANVNTHHYRRADRLCAPRRPRTTPDPAPFPAPAAGRVPALERLEPRRLLSASAAPRSFYVSSTGNDASNGLSPATAWQTLAPVNATTFHAGDRIYLQGGGSFAGPLAFTAADTGTAALPITVTSYGSGTATITAAAGDIDAIDITDTAGIDIHNLTLLGAGPFSNDGDGINLTNDQAGSTQFDHVAISDVDASGFGFVGIGLNGTTGGAGFSGVSVIDSALHNNKWGGFFAQCAQDPSYAVYDFTNILLDHVRAYANTGNAGSTDAGSGIVLSHVQDGTIQYCDAYQNGADNNSYSGGPDGIWSYDSDSVVIQFCQAYDNYGLNTDGGGFDFDGGSVDCLMQYNYSHDNDGSGLMVCQVNNFPTNTGDVIRYNISQNDGRRNYYPGIEIYDPGAGFEVTNADIYNNTVYISQATQTPAGALRVVSPTTNVHIYNNIFYTTGGVTTAYIAYAGTGLLFQGNDYWTGSASAITVNWLGTVYNTLPAWQAATGAEVLNGNAVGEAVDPQFTNPGNGGTLASADQLPTLTAYRLAASSPLIDAGVNLSNIGLTPAPSADFYGDAVPQGSGFDVGAIEAGPVGPLVITAPGATAASIYLSTSSNNLNLWINASTPGAGTPTQTVPISNLTAVDVLANGASDVITFALGGGYLPASVPVRFAGDASGSAGGSTLNIQGASNGSNFTFSNTAVTVGSTTISCDHVSAITLTGGAGNDTLTQTATPLAAVTFNGRGGSDSLTVNAGTFTFTGNPELATPSLSVNDNAAVAFATGTAGGGIAVEQLASLSLGSGALASIAAPDTAADRAVLVLSQLSLASAATLDLSTNDLIVRSTAASTITAAVAAGYSSGASPWTGAGITSTAAAAAPDSNTALAALAAPSAGTFDGVSVSPSDVVIKYTYAGDANLDGTVNGDDYSLIDHGYSTHATGWANGDFTYDGAINIADYALTDNAYATQGMSLGKSFVAGASPSVLIDPTPAAATAIASPATILAIAATSRRASPPVAATPPAALASAPLSSVGNNPTLAEQLFDDTASPIDR